VKLRERPVDAVFVVFFALFCVGWFAFDMPAALGLIEESTGWYAREVDPIFQDPPLWLRTIGWFALVYGPAYGAIAYGFFRRRAWLSSVLLPLAGLITATNVIYWVEELAGEVPPKNMTIFVALNLPYLVIPPLAAVRAVAARGLPGATAAP
jgi:hypothetical protein